MPKQKVHKGLKRRVKITANKKVKYKKAGGSHLMSAMSPKRRRSLGKACYIDGSIQKTTLRQLCAE